MTPDALARLALDRSLFFLVLMLRHLSLGGSVTFAATCHRCALEEAP